LKTVAWKNFSAHGHCEGENAVHKTVETVALKSFSFLQIIEVMILYYFRTTVASNTIIEMSCSRSQLNPFKKFQVYPRKAGYFDHLMFFKHDFEMYSLTLKDKTEGYM
jgi:hypothetical protein